MYNMTYQLLILRSHMSGRTFKFIYHCYIRTVFLCLSHLCLTPVTFPLSLCGMCYIFSSLFGRWHFHLCLICATFSYVWHLSHSLHLCVTGVTFCHLCLTDVAFSCLCLTDVTFSCFCLTDVTFSYLCLTGVTFSYLCLTDGTFSHLCLTDGTFLHALHL